MTATKTTHNQPHTPMLRVTRYDRVSAWLIACVVALLIAVCWLSVVWATNRLPLKTELATLELIELSGGDEDGVIDETLRLDSPEDVSVDPSLAETVTEESEIQEMLETVVELADEATNQAQQQYELDAQNTGQPGSATGTGRQALGLGSGQTGLSREQRWFIRFTDRATLSTYAQQLDFFGIELAILKPDGEMQYLSQLSVAQPRVRKARTGKNEKRLFMTWQGGDRRKADIQLFQKAGLDIGDGLIFQFYSAKTEALLAKLERGYRNRPVGQIRRTYFMVLSAEDGFKFAVTRQTYFQ